MPIRRSRFACWVKESGSGFTIPSAYTLPAMSQRQREQSPRWKPDLALSAQPTAKLEIICERCARRGRFTAFRLFAEFGDRYKGLPLLMEIARKAGCERAKHPPNLSDIGYLHKLCEIRQVSPADDYVPEPTVYSRMHGGWKLFISCGRHHQGLKRAKPCPVPPAELDLPTLVAALGHDFKVDALHGRLVTPCCESRSFGLEWVPPALAPR